MKSGKTYFYKLEDIDTDGTSTIHGPIEVTVVEGLGAVLNKNNEPSLFAEDVVSSNLQGTWGSQTMARLLDHYYLLVTFCFTFGPACMEV